MKRLISILLSCSLILSGCMQGNDKFLSDKGQATEVNENSNGKENTQSVIEEDEKVDSTPYTYEAVFSDLKDDELIRYVEDSLYSEIVSEINSDEYFIENIYAVYISQEYIDEIGYNSKANFYFGYSLEEINEVFEGTRYVFTMGSEGETIVTEFKEYDNTYEQVIKNVAMGTGVILISVTVSVVSAGLGAPAISMIFAASAKTGTTVALSSGAFSGVVAGAVKGIKTKDMDQTLKAATLAGSKSFKWGAIMGSTTGGISQLSALKGATLNGLTMNEAAIIQKKSGYPLDVIKEFHKMEEFEVLHNAGLKSTMINGRIALAREVELLNIVDEFGRTNTERIRLGLSPIDSTGVPFELHHIGQRSDATLAILTKEEHKNPVLHGMKKITEIDRDEFAITRRRFWKEYLNMVEAGDIFK